MASNSLDQTGHKFTAYYERDGLPNNGVVGILEDGHGDLWLGTHNGMSRFESANRKTFTNYYVSDGLAGQSVQFLCKGIQEP